MRKTPVTWSLAWLALLGLVLGCGKSHPLSSANDQSPSALAKPAGKGLLPGAELTKHQAVVIATVTRSGVPVSNMEVAFSRAVAGRASDFRWRDVTNTDGQAQIEIVEDSPQFWRTGASGYYTVTAIDPMAASPMNQVVGRWDSVPIRGGKISTLTLPIGKSASPTPPSLETLDSFYLRVTPRYMSDAIGGQHCIIMVDVEDLGGSDAGGPVTLSATAPEVEIIVEPQVIVPGQVAEITVIPRLVASDEPGPTPRLKPLQDDPLPPGPIRPEPGDDDLLPVDPYDDPFGPGPKEIVTLNIRGERGDEIQTQTATIVVRPGEDLLLDPAVEMRDRFIPWLTQNHPELGITTQTGWTGTIVTPHILVVTHYLFLTDEWEMEVRWHVMIPPYDWTVIYLRRRGVETRPSYAFKIDSVSGNTTPYMIDPPEAVWR